MTAGPVTSHAVFHFGTGRRKLTKAADRAACPCGLMV